MTTGGFAALLNGGGQLTITAPAANTFMIHETGNQISVDGITGSVAASRGQIDRHQL